MDAYVVAGSHDMALDAARMLTTAPVIGIGEAAFHFASILSCKFDVITTLPRIVPVVEQNLTKYGLIARCAKVRALGIPVLALETSSKEAERHKFNLVSAEIDKAIKEDGAEAVTLGCGGFADMAEELSEKHGIPVIEGVGCAVKLAESFVSLGMKNSKIGGYATPNPKVFNGIFNELSPGV
jgi:allantoin racemase